jgi:hypothetical protein
MGSQTDLTRLAEAAQQQSANINVTPDNAAAATASNVPLYTKSWNWFKWVLRGLSFVSCVVLLGVSANGQLKFDLFGYPAWYIYMPCVSSNTSHVLKCSSLTRDVRRWCA